jgi:hypothetical protein
MNINGYTLFPGCCNLTNITVDDRNYWYTSIDGILFDKDKKTIICYPQGKKAGTYSIPPSVTAIGDGAFSGCENLTSINIPSSVRDIGDAFPGCSNLTNITVDNRNPAYASIDGVLFDKDKTYIIKYPEGKKTGTYSIPSSVTGIGHSAFIGCENLININIPSSVTALRRLFDAGFDGDSSSVSSNFFGCNNLTSITVDSRNPSYTSIDGVLFNKDKTTIMKYPEGKAGAYSIPSSVTAIGNSAFSDCKNLTNINIPSSVMAIGNSAFSDCINLTSINIPSSVTNIGNFAFSGCENLTSISIPSSVMDIGRGAFSGCINLTSINIPSSVTAIGEGAFAGCENLTSISIPSSVMSIGSYAFIYCNLTSVTISRRTQVGENAFPESARITYRD